MAIGKKVSPAKFLGAATIVGGVLKGATQIYGGIQERKRLRNEQRRAKDLFRQQRRDLQNIEITNPYANIKTDFENPYEDLTVNQQQAQFESQQAAQSRANILGSLQGAAGGSGIAGLAQAIANRATADRARASASIGQQEARNQSLAAQGASQVQAREAAAERQIAAGEASRQANEAERQRDLIQLRAGFEADQRAMRQQRGEAFQQIVGGIGTFASTALTGFQEGIFKGDKNTSTTNTNGIVYSPGDGKSGPLGDMDGDGIPDFIDPDTQ